MRTELTSAPESRPGPSRSGRFLPRIGTPGYHLMLGAVAILILGPLGGVSAAFMNFSIGFFIGGQVLAGILGSTVTLPYGPEGKHGANYIQTMSASVAGLCGMAVLVQAMVWLGLPEPPAWKLILYLLCIGMFGVGVGMLYTPLLVDRMQLAYPSGFAVANILRALTDKTLLKRSIAKLGGGMLVGYGGGVAALKIASVGATSLSTGTIGAGMIVGARIAIPAFVVGITGLYLTPYLRSIHWLGPNESFRKIGFIISLGTILGAAIVDITLILIQFVGRLRNPQPEAAGASEDWKRVNMVRLVLWTLFWAAAVIVVGNQLMGAPVKFLAIAVGLSFLFMLVNGISQGISDWNPISSAFVMTIFILVALSLHDPIVGLLCAAIVFIACSTGCDMQQDRSTGWRLGTNRVLQFRYQVLGIVMGAILAVALAKLFMNAYPVLREDQFSHQVAGAEKWQSTMTFKMVGALKAITDPKPYVMTALKLGIAIGLFIEITRKLIKRTAGYKRFAAGSRTGRVTDFLIDAVFLASPYASSFGGFVELPAVYWWTAGGVGSSLFEALQGKLKSSRARPAEGGELPADMSVVSLVGGGLIAGESLAALSIGIISLLKTVL
jgi:uncharacterized oligopeptide transporter (OPT) family protein